jgi:Zn-dependent protease with chaperone function
VSPESTFVLACAGLAAIVGGVAGPLAVRLARRVSAPAPGRAASTRADAAFLSALIPALAALGVVGGTLMPSVLTAAGLVADHCDDHGHHVHVCLAHGATTPGWLAALGAVALAVYATRAGLRLADVIRGARATRALERLGVRETHAGFPATRVPGAPRLCFATGVFRRRIVYSAALADHLSASELSAALAHEAAHLRRRDPLVLAILSVAGLFAWPSVARASRALFLAAAEEACDAEAAVTHGPEAVARALVAAARLQLSVANGLSLTGRTLTARVSALVTTDGLCVAPARGLVHAWVLPSALGVAVALFGAEVHHAVETVLSLID